MNSLFVSKGRSLHRRFSVLRGHLAPRFLYAGPCEWLQTLRLNSRDSALMLHPWSLMSTIISALWKTRLPQNAYFFSGRLRPPTAYAVFAFDPWPGAAAFSPLCYTFSALIGLRAELTQLVEC